MTHRSTLAYGAVFLFLMAAAYASWTHEEEPGSDEGVVLLDAGPDDVESVRFEGEDLEATLEVRTDDLGRYAWVTTTRTIAAAGPDPSAPSGAGATRRQEFKAGTTGDQLLEDLAPLEVVRELEVTDKDLEEFGLDDPKGKLVVSAGGKEVELEIGAPGYGHRNVYLRDAETKKVYVAKKTMINPLERADTRLPDKRLIEFERGDVAGVEIVSGGTSLELVQKNREDAAAARWTPPGSDESVETAQNWLDKVFRLRANGYVPAKETPSPLEPAFSVHFRPAEGKPVRLEVLRSQTPDGEPAYFAKSQFTRGLVELSAPIASDVVEDLATVLPAE